MTISIYDELSDTSPEFLRKKRRKIDNDTTSTSTTTAQFRWKSSAEQQTYSSKLINALRQVHNRRTHAPPFTAARVVREAADATLAVSDKGRTRWSRAILTNRAKRRLKNHQKAKIRSKTPLPPLKTAAFPAENSLAIEKRVKLLGKLVPGCKKLSFPNLLEETSDYIAALQMQVRAMSALAQLLSGSASSTGSIDIEPESSNNRSINDDYNDADNPAH